MIDAGLSLLLGTSLALLLPALSPIRPGPLLERISAFSRRFFRDDLENALERGGLAGKGADRFRKRQVALGCSGLLTGALLSTFGFPWWFAVTAAAIGYSFPRLRLSSTIRKRQRSILSNLPYYLDLATLALEAGLDLVASLEEILRHDRPNPLRDEFATLLAEIRMGSTRTEAFSALASRTQLRSLSLLASAVTQSEEFGTSLGPLLRLQSESIRRELKRQAEEAAARAPLKLLIPLIGLIFPVVFLLLFAPLFLRFFM
jgi:tight adherence protein C